MMEPHPHSEPDPDTAEGIGMSERRSAPRYDYNVQTEGYKLGAHGSKSWVATVTNISTAGVALMLRQRVKPGTVLVIKLQTGKLHLSRPIPVRVMHVRQEEEGLWLHGCAFVRKLRDEELPSIP